MTENMTATPNQSRELRNEIEYYRGIIAKMPPSSPFSINAHIKLGKLYWQLGDKENALEEYVAAAVTYADNGDVVKALAVNKLMAEMTPEYKDTSNALNSLYFRHGDSSENGTKNHQSLLSDDDIYGEEAEIASHLRCNPLFACLNWTERQWVEENVTLYHFAKDAAILQKGHEQEALFVILEGYVKIVLHKDGKPEQVLAILGPDDFFGEVSLLHQQQSGASVVAEGACSIIEMSKTVFATLIKKHPSIAETLEHYSTRRTLDITLAEIPLFHHLSGVERQKIMDFLSPLSVKQGSMIVAEGDAGDCMFLIKSGRVGVYTSLMMEKETESPAEADQRQLHLASLHEGDFFGEQALITNERRNATVLAITDVQLLRFSKPDLEVIVKNYPRIAEVLKQYHHQRTTDTMESLHVAFQKMLTDQHSPHPG